MGGPDNGVYIVQGEVSHLMTAMRRNSRWTSHSHQDNEQDPLTNSFGKLRDALNNISDLEELTPNEFLAPFLDVIRSEDTTGPITGLALSSVNKLLSYGLINPENENAAPAIENIADAVTHARFVGTDPASDEVVLMKILHVLRTLMLTPAGAQLTNESVCEIMQSCFRICFEMRLSELLRKDAEHTLMDMAQLLFSRLPQFKEDSKWAINMKKLKMRAGGMDTTRSKKQKKSPKPKQKKMKVSAVQNVLNNQLTEKTEPEQAPDNVSGSLSKAEGPTGPLHEIPDGTQVVIDQECMEGKEEIENDVETAAIPDSLPTPPESDPTSPDELSLQAQTIATTPVAPGRTVVDIHNDFQDATETEEIETQPEESKEIPHTVVQIEEPVETEQEETNTSVAEAIAEAANESLEKVPDNIIKSEEKKPLSIPETAKLELDQVDGDRSSCASDLADVESVPSVNADADDVEYINPRGIRFTPGQQDKEGSGPLIPYGMPCVRELFRFLISIINPIDRHNTDVMVHMGLHLLTVALESGADHIASFNSLLTLVKDDMCRNLFFLLQSDRLSLFAASIRVCFLLFESMRGHLKFQLEMYLTKLMDIIVSDPPKVSYEQRELSLESVVQMCRIPGLIAEMYVDYDCDLYCSNLFEELMKLLSKNAFPVSGLFSTHLLSLEALLAAIDGIEQHCHQRVLQASKTSDTEKPTEVKSGEDPEAASSTAVPPPPPIGGFNTGSRMGSITDIPDATKGKGKGDRKRKIKPNRMKVSEVIPSEEELNSVKQKKKLYHTGTEQFAIKPSKGIAFLQEQGILSSPLDPEEVVWFFKENPKLCKKMLGEYLSNKKNSKVLEAYQRSFKFENSRIDECLRMYLETFRLPGEAPVISYLLEHFADHWHKANGEPFASADAAFTLSYAVIMLNVDQHNYNAKKQNIPMTLAEFRKNVKGVNGGKDFDQDMLEEIYHAIKNEEIVMPAEQTGLVRDNYLWKVLLRRGATPEGRYIHVPTGAYDRDLFTIVWGPTVAALSFVFDKSSDDNIIHKAISGFRKCAMIAAHYSLSDVFDNLVISLCKFTTLLSVVESAENIPIHFGSNAKAQLAAKTVFELAHRHGDILREGWKNMLDCMLQLYRAKLLPELLVTAEDFLHPNCRISLIKEDTSEQQKTDTGVFSSMFSYFSMSETPQQKQPTFEEQEASKQAQGCIEECHLEQLITDSKFLTDVSLQELVKALIMASQPPDPHEHVGCNLDDDASVFFLEFLIKVALQNRDRLAPFWSSIRDHIYALIVHANESTFLVERAVVGLLRLAIRLLRREEIAPQVLTSLKILLMMKPAVVHSVSRQISYGLHELLRTNAANIHQAHDWFVLFTLLETAGAGTNPPSLMRVVDPNVMQMSDSNSDSGAQSDGELATSQTTSDSGDRGYTSDPEMYGESQDRHHVKNDFGAKMDPNSGSWLVVTKNSTNVNAKTGSALPNQFDIALEGDLKHHDTKSLMKSCETLAFLVRDAAHITPHNFESCVHSIRTFVEASINGGQSMKKSRTTENFRNRKTKHRKGLKKSRSSPSHLAEEADSEEEREADGYHSLSIQLLDLMHTLHTRAASIFSSWAEEEKKQPGAEPYQEGMFTAEAGTLWIKCWCPLLQGIARLCCDTRKQVRSQALTYLQRALLVHDLQTLSAVEWESCFNKMLFPLLSKLLENFNPQDPNGIEETRMRASTLLCKVFLQHLSPLMSLSTFTALWLTILDFMDKYMHADKSDLLNEAVPESLKNMLLVMHTAGILSADSDNSQLWKLTWDRIDTFLPMLRREVFKPHEIAEPKRPVMREAAGNQDMVNGTSADNPQTPVTAAKHEQETAQPHAQSQQEHQEAPAVDRSTSPSAKVIPTGRPGQYILHPPLPNVNSSTSMTTSQPTTVPLLLNPAIIQGTTIPIISTQKVIENAAKKVIEPTEAPVAPPPKDAVVVEDI